VNEWMNECAQIDNLFGRTFEHIIEEFWMP
jgi:hypothetical protein